MSVSPPPKLHNHRPTLAWCRLDSLSPSPRHPRTYKRADRARVVAMVERFGPLPMVVTSAGVAVSSNIWHAAAVEAGYDETPVRVTDHLSPAEADIVMLSIVKLVERGEWDDQLLGEIILDLSVGELKCDLDLTGFEPASAVVAAAAKRHEGRSEGPAGGPGGLSADQGLLADWWGLLACLVSDSGLPRRWVGNLAYYNRFRDSQSPLLARVIGGDVPARGRHALELAPCVNLLGDSLDSTEVHFGPVEDHVGDRRMTARSFAANNRLSVHLWARTQIMEFPS